MARGYYARIVPVRGFAGGGGDEDDEQPVDPGYGVEEGDQIGGGPIVPPPLPGVWPKPGEPTHPIYVPPQRPGRPSHPIVLPMPPTKPDVPGSGSPSHPIELPPGTIWPPLPPDVDTGGKTAILVWVVGVGYRWFVYDPPGMPSKPDKPPEAGPKR